MKYSKLSQIELDGLLIGITDLYRLYNPSAIPTDEPPNNSNTRFSLRRSSDSNRNQNIDIDELFTNLRDNLRKSQKPSSRRYSFSGPLDEENEEDKEKESHQIRYSLGSSKEDLKEPQETFDANYSAEKAKKRDEIRKAREEKENKQRQSTKYEKLDVIKNSKNENSRNTLKEIRAKGYSLFDHLSLFIDNILGKKRSKNLNYQIDLQLAPTFSELLVNYISEKGLNNADVYKAAQIDRRHFSKIISNTLYNPTRDTVFSLIIALKLNMEEAEDLMATAGYAFSKSSKRDVVLEYFIRTQNYDINEINEVLYQLNLNLLNS